MTIAIARFLGSNCDRDCLYVFQKVLEQTCVFVWHDDSKLPADTKAVVIPGGFSYGDYLRCGALAARRPVIGAIKNFIAKGGPVIGICNGFQILCEAQILPGALLPNHHGRFVCTLQKLLVCGGGVGILKTYSSNEVIQLPIAHHDGNYYADQETLDDLEKNKRVALRYADVDENGFALVNGSSRGIAGIFGGPFNNVLGLMPHPERRSLKRLGGVDGISMLKGLVQA